MNPFARYGVLLVALIIGLMIRWRISWMFHVMSSQNESVQRQLSRMYVTLDLPAFVERRKRAAELYTLATEILNETYPLAVNRSRVVDVVTYKSRGVWGDFRMHIFSAPNKKKTPLPTLIHIGGSFDWRLPEAAIQHFYGHRMVQALLDANISAAVIELEHRLAPNYFFPSAVDDARDVLKYIDTSGEAYGVDKHRLVIGGVGTGANIAIALALSRAARVPDVCQIGALALVAPVVDLSPGYNETKSFAANVAFGFSAASIADAFEQYCPRVNACNASAPHVSPLLVSLDKLAQLPPTVVKTKGRDPFDSSANEFRKKLMKAGVRVESQRCDKCTFFTLEHPEQLYAPYVSAFKLMLKR